jgi:hypothetical protein
MTRQRKTRLTPIGGVAVAEVEQEAYQENINSQTSV